MKRSEEQGGESGFSLVELLLVVAVVCVVASFAFMQIATASQRARLDASAREFTGHLEKVRADSIRRHAAPGQEASVTVAGPTSYTVVADYNGDGTIGAGESRTVELPDGVTFVTSPPPPSASFDWRGRLAAGMSFNLTSPAGSTSINLTPAGDAILGGAAPTPTIAATPFPTPTPTPAPTPTPTPAQPGGVGGCSIALYPASLTIRKNGLTTGQLDLMGSIYGDPGTATITFDSTQLKLTYGSGSTLATPTQSFTIGPTTPVRFAVTDVKNTTSGYVTYIDVTSDCGDYSTAITVTN